MLKALLLLTSTLFSDSPLLMREELRSFHRPQLDPLKVEENDYTRSVFDQIQPISVIRPQPLVFNARDVEISCILGQGLSLEHPKCVFEVNGNTLKVDLAEEVVRDQFGNVMSNMDTVRDDEGRKCGLKFESFPNIFVNSEWRCSLQSSEQKFEHRAVFGTLLDGDFVSNVRLPNTITPTHYDVELVPILDEKSDRQFTVPGHVDITFEHDEMAGFPELSRVLMLHIDELFIQESSITLNNNILSFNALEYDVERQFFTIHLDEPLQSRRAYRLQMDFFAHVHQRIGRGMFRGFYETSNEKHWMVSTQMQPIGARRTFPCFDEPHLKATFTLRLGRESQMTAWSNGELVASHDLMEHTAIDEVMLEGLENYQLDIFKETVSMSTYLVAFLIAEMDHLAMDSELPMSVIYQPGFENWTTLALNFSPPCMELVEEVFDSDYQTEKIDLAAVPSMTGWAMENWGLQLYAPQLLLWKPEEFNLIDRELVQLVIAHELIHNWVGNSVTLAWWDDLWLNEGVTSHYDSVILDKLDNSTDRLAYSVRGIFQVVMDQDAMDFSVALNAPVFNPRHDVSFGLINYFKGSVVVRMMTKLIGEEDFNSSLQTYLDKFAFNSVSSPEFLDAFNDAFDSASGDHVHKSFAELLMPFVKQPGYPVVTVTKVSATDQAFDVSLRQKRYLVNSESDDNSKWHIPIFVGTTSGHQADFDIDTKKVQWMDESDEEVVVGVPSLPYVLNTQHGGYYRVNYDLANWASLTDSLLRATRPEEAIADTVTRATLIDDAFALYESGDLDLSIPLQLIQFLAKETNRGVIDTAIYRLSGLINVYQTVSMAELESFGNYLRSLFHPIYKKFSVKRAVIEWSSEDIDNFLPLLTTKSVTEVAFVLNMKETLAECSVALQSESDTTEDLDPNPVPNDLLTAVMKCGLSNADIVNDQQLHHVLNVARGESRDRKKMAYVAALGSLTNTRLMGLLMDILLKPNEPISSLSHLVFRGMRGNGVGSTAAFQWLKARIEEVEVLHDDLLLLALHVITAHAQNVGKEDELQEIRDFVKDNADKLASMTNRLEAAITSGQQALQGRLSIAKDIINARLPKPTSVIY